MFWAKEAKVLDAKVTLSELAYMFSTVNLENRLKSTEQLDAYGLDGVVPTLGAAKELPSSSSKFKAAAEGSSLEAAEIEEDEDALCYAEWRDVLVRVARERNEPRGGTKTSPQPHLAEYLDTWLERELMPHLEIVIKGKQRGIGQKNIS